MNFSILANVAKCNGQRSVEYGGYFNTIIYYSTTTENLTSSYSKRPRTDQSEVSNDESEDMIMCRVAKAVAHHRGRNRSVFRNV